MFKILFLDLDDTILDFHKAERIAIAKTIREFGVEPTEDVLTLYHHINKRHWEMLERGELNRDQVKVRRFGALFQELGLNVDAPACALAYENSLSIGHYFLPGAEKAVESLRKKYRLFLASNGTAKVQAGRMTSANLYRFFEKVFVSEQMGCNKPSAAFFEACFAQIPDFDKASAMMVGDSLTSDMKGANNAGIAACWVNPNGAPRPADIHIDFEIKALSELEGLLNTL